MHARSRTRCRRRKKKAEVIRQEITREVEQLLRVVFQSRRKTGRVDLEALETLVRSAMHRAGAAALSELLRFPAPMAESGAFPAVVAIKPITGSCAPNRSSPPWAR